MLERMFNRGSIPALEAMVSFASARHKTVAANIANADTPGYKVMDVNEGDFKKAMSRAFKAQNESSQGTWEMERQGSVRPGRFGRALEARPLEAKDTGILKHIENNVDLEIEMGKMVKNSAMHSLATNLLAHQFNLLREAISERVNS